MNFSIYFINKYRQWTIVILVVPETFVIVTVWVPLGSWLGDGDLHVRSLLGYAIGVNTYAEVRQQGLAEEVGLWCNHNKGLADLWWALALGWLYRVDLSWNDKASYIHSSLLWNHSRYWICCTDMCITVFSFNMVIIAFQYNWFSLQFYLFYSFTNIILERSP